MSLREQVTVHTCPACQNWQVDYTIETVRTYSLNVWPPDAAYRAYEQIIEDVLLDHLLTCFGVPQ